MYWGLRLSCHCAVTKNAFRLKALHVLQQIQYDINQLPLCWSSARTLFYNFSAIVRVSLNDTVICWV